MVLFIELNVYFNMVWLWRIYKILADIDCILTKNTDVYYTGHSYLFSLEHTPSSFKKNFKNIVSLEFCICLYLVYDI